MTLTEWARAVDDVLCTPRRESGGPHPNVLDGRWYGAYAQPRAMPVPVRMELGLVTHGAALSFEGRDQEGAFTLGGTIDPNRTARFTKAYLGILSHDVLYDAAVGDGALRGVWRLDGERGLFSIHHAAMFDEARVLEQDRVRGGRGDGRLARIRVTFGLGGHTYDVERHNDLVSRFFDLFPALRRLP